jgi:hypothetical protein
VYGSADIVLVLNLRGKCSQFTLRAGNEDEVVALGGKLQGELLANAIGGAGDDGPGALAAELGEL